MENRCQVGSFGSFQSLLIQITGSPFNVSVTDNDRTLGYLLSDSLLKNVSLSKGVEFQIENRNNHASQCRVLITSKRLIKIISLFTNLSLQTAPSGQKITPKIEKLPEQFKVNFNPAEIGNLVIWNFCMLIISYLGPHQIVITLDGVTAPGCPYTCNVYDVHMIKVSRLTNCYVGKPFTFLGKNFFKVFLFFLIFV